MKIKKVDYRLVLAVVFGLFLSLALVFFLNNKYNTGSIAKNAFTGLLDTVEQPIDLTITLGNSKLGKGLDLGLAPKSQKNISSFSIRLSAPYDPALFNPDNVAFTPSQNLVAAGWLFPVKDITVDQAKKVFILDISGVNTTPDGFVISKPFNIGTVDYFSGQQNLPLTLSVDRSETKILAKDASELNYDFVSQ